MNTGIGLVVMLACVFGSYVMAGGKFDVAEPLRCPSCEQRFRTRRIDGGQLPGIDGSLTHRGAPVSED